MKKENEKGLVEKDLEKDALLENDKKLSTDDLDAVSGGMAISTSQVRHMQHELGKDGKPGVKF